MSKEFTRVMHYEDPALQVVLDIVTKKIYEHVRNLQELTENTPEDVNQNFLPLIPIVYSSVGVLTNNYLDELEHALVQLGVGAGEIDMVKETFNAFVAVTIIDGYDKITTKIEKQLNEIKAQKAAEAV